MKAKFDFGGFIRECYLRSTPSIDISRLSDGCKADCPAHRLSVAEYKKLLCEYGITNEHGDTLDHDRLVGCNIWMLNSGPHLYEEPKAA